MSFPEEPLPRIACFHGGGSTASIFTVQSEQLIKLLSNTFQFVFFDAPFERDAGPGVLPIFTYDKYGPYRTWFSRSPDGTERPDGRGEDGRGEGGVREGRGRAQGGAIREERGLRNVLTLPTSSPTPLPRAPRVTRLAVFFTGSIAFETATRNPQACRKAWSFSASPTPISALE